MDELVSSKEIERLDIYRIVGTRVAFSLHADEGQQPKTIVRIYRCDKQDNAVVPLGIVTVHGTIVNLTESKVIILNRIELWFMQHRAHVRLLRE